MRAVAFTLLVAALAGPTLAQEVAEDWDLTTDPQQQLTLASLDFGSNALALRCKAGVLELLLTGTPVATSDSRSVEVTAGLIANEKQTWQTQAGLTVLSASEPDRLARQIRAGGELDIRIDGAAVGERPRRYRLPIPASAVSVDQVLVSCGRPLSDDWDGLPRSKEMLAWNGDPTPDFPEAAMQAGADVGAVVLGCIVAAGGDLDVCRILSETPTGVGFGKEALKAARASQVRLAPGNISDLGRFVQFTIRFRAE